MEYAQDKQKVKSIISILGETEIASMRRARIPLKME